MGDSTISVWIGNGDGTFQPRYTVPAVPSTGPYSTYVTEAVAVGDFNGDGNLDLAVLCLNPSDAAPNFSGILTILLGDGTGHFGAPTAIVLDGLHPVQVLTGDFNDDKKTDLAVLNATSESVTILLGNGDGTFTALPDTPVLPNTSSEVVGSMMASADFNKDGNLDLVVVDDDGIGVLLGNGDGTFQPVENLVVRGGSSLAVGDFNNDGIPDIVATGADETG